MFDENLSNTMDILEIIATINKNFDDLYLKYSMQNMIEANIPITNPNDVPKHNVFNYYLHGHCPSYSRILCSIFKDKATVYCSDSHVITKIGEHFYDVRGIIDDLVTSEFTDANCAQGLLYIEMMFGVKDSVEAPIENELINIGIKKLEELEELEELKNTKIKQKTI